MNALMGSCCMNPSLPSVVPAQVSSTFLDTPPAASTSELGRFLNKIFPQSKLNTLRTAPLSSMPLPHWLLTAAWLLSAARNDMFMRSISPFRRNRFFIHKTWLRLPNSLCKFDMRIYIYIYTYVCVKYIYICIYIHICIYTYYIHLYITLNFKSVSFNIIQYHSSATGAASASSMQVFQLQRWISPGFFENLPYITPHRIVNNQMRLNPLAAQELSSATIERLRCSCAPWRPCGSFATQVEKLQ